jgi:starvation-inducible DNA-binding protein
MHRTRNDLSEQVRRKAINHLSGRLADAIDPGLPCNQAHWNDKGPRFAALHPLFDAIASVVGGQVDALAQRVTALGGTAEGTAQAIAERSSLDS